MITYTVNRRLLLCFIGMALPFILLTGCSHDAAKPKDEVAVQKDNLRKATDSDSSQGQEHKEAPDKIEMTPAAITQAGITVEKIMKHPVNASFSAPGRVIPTQNGIAHVGTIVGGRISRLFVSEGRYVRQGEALAEIEAFDIGELKGEYLRARSNVEQTKLAWERAEKLAEEKIGAQRSLEEAQSAYSQAVSAQRVAATKLHAVGIRPQHLETSGAFSSHIILRSPIAGVISKREASLGQFIEPSKDVFQVVNTNTVWVDAQVPPSSASDLKAGGVGFAQIAQGERRAGRIIYIAPGIDTESRTVTVRIALDNRNNQFRPEAFVTVEFQRSVSGYALAVPTTALEQEGAQYYVYREDDQHIFHRVEVAAGQQSGNMTIISAGINEGDRVVISGVFYLKSARQKNELSED